MTVPLQRSTARAPGIAVVTLLLLGACENTNRGNPPPSDKLFFPSGLLLDPRVAPDEAARYLFVVNSNNDLSHNAGTVLAIDLEDFFSRWAVDQDTFAVDPYCDPHYPEWLSEDEQAAGLPAPRCVQQVGSSINDDYPCRRLALLPQVVECDEEPLVATYDDDGDDDTPEVPSVARTGDFGTLLAASCNDGNTASRAACERPRLWLPVRGDPSITYIDLFKEPDPKKTGEAAPEGGELGPPILTCGQDPDEDGRCDKQHRLTHLLNDSSLVAVDREPFNLLVSPSEPLAYVAHSDGYSLSLLDLLGHPRGCCSPSLEATCDVTSVLDCVCGDDDGEHGHDACCAPDEVDGHRVPGPEWDRECVYWAETECGVCRPAMIDQAVAFPSLGGLPGGLGLAERPCNVDDAPSITLNCTRPLVYAGFRYSRLLVSFTVQGSAPIEDPAHPEYSQHCAGPTELDQPNAIVCDPRVRSQRQVFPGGLDPGGASYTPVLGDIAFADELGEHLLVTQTNPGALLLLDTTVGPDGEVVDNPSRPPLEICDQPTRMKLYDEGGQRFVLISCYRAAQIFVVDLDAFRVIDAVVAGTGPFELEVDRARRLLYVSNNLESSISVIDLAADRSTRFTEIARIGLQDPFTR